MSRLAIGSILPSSNRTVERTTIAVMRHFPEVDPCFGRITYYGASIGQPADGYNMEEYRHVAWQLSHSRVGVVTWNGTKGASAGLEVDRQLCAVMAEAAGCKATTASLDVVTLLRAFGAKKLGFVTPGATSYAVDAAAGLGAEAVAVRSLGLTDNYDSCEVAPERIMDAARAVASDARCDAILLWSTNLPGWMTMAPLEAELGIPVIDSAAAGVWGCLAALGVDPRPAAGLGRIFSVI
jgi:maleate isomerase